VRVEIGGYTDSRNSDKYNLELSRKRAESVKAYLVDHGVDANQLEVKGYGESKPIASNETITGMAKNRRVELKKIE
jgi:OOP family OmpA-OmpF porin